MRHLVALAGVIVAAFHAPGAGAAPPATPVWLSSEGDRFAVATNGEWLDLEAHGKARVVQVNDRGIVAASDPLDRQGKIQIWASTCPRGAQTIRLRRTVELPGPVGDVGAFIAPITGPGFSISSAELWVNGHRVLKTGSRGGAFEPKPVLGTFFKFGENDVELVATKAPNPGGVARCNTSEATKVAILAAVRGEFATDLALVEPAPVDQAYAAAGTPHVLGETHFTVRNKGPGGVARGRFYFKIQLPYTDDVEFVQPSVPKSGPFRSCVFSEVKATLTYEGSCEFTNFRARDSYVLSFKYGASNSKQARNVYVLVRWGISMYGTDTNGANNERIVRLWFCETGVADDRKSCKAG